MPVVAKAIITTSLLGKDNLEDGGYDHFKKTVKEGKKCLEPQKFRTKKDLEII